MDRMTEWFQSRRDKIGWDGIVFIVIILVVLVIVVRVCAAGSAAS
jgi:t-SNARE complex subunit (syntaxin)